MVPEAAAQAVVGEKTSVFLSSTGADLPGFPGAGDTGPCELSLVWVLPAKARFSARAASNLNSWAISPDFPLLRNIFACQVSGFLLTCELKYK